jgi:hypothetical protein
MIDVPARQHNGPDWTPAQGLLGLEMRARGNLLADVGRTIEDYPIRPVAGNSERRLGSPRDAPVSPPVKQTHPAAAIPLRKAAAGCGTSYNYLQ